MRRYPPKENFFMFRELSQKSDFPEAANAPLYSNMDSPIFSEQDDLCYTHKR